MPKSRIPSPLLPLVAALQFFGNSYKTPLALFHRYGKLIDLNAARGGALVAIGPEYNQQVFTDTRTFHTIDASTFPVKIPANSAFYRLWNNGLLQMNGERHDQQRRLMMPALHKKQTEHYRALIIAEVEKRLDMWRNGEIRDLLQDMRDLTAAIATCAFLGLDPDQEGAALHQIFGRWTSMVQSPIALGLPLEVPGSPFYRLLRLSESVEQTLAAMLAEKRVALQHSDAQDGLTTLIHAQDEDGTHLTDNEIMGQIGTFYVAGHETTASALTWAVLLLAQHPHVYAKLVDEIAPLAGNAPTTEQTSQLPLLDGVIKETLRLLPPLPFMIRNARAAFTMGGVEFPIGVNVALSPFVTHRLPDIYADPAKFLPERWASISPSSYEYIPFGAGSRMCLGAAFAMAELKIVLPMIIGRFHLTNLQGAKVDYAASIFAAPRGGLPMRVQLSDKVGKHAYERVKIVGTLHDIIDF